MIDLGTIAQFTAAVFFLVIGIRLLRLSLRTGEIPERLLGTYFVFAGLAYGVWQLQTYLEQAWTGDPIDLLAWSLYAVGVIPFLHFSRVVFRPDSAWATWLVRLTTVSLVTGLTMWMVQAREYYVLDNPWYWAVWLGYSIPCAWFAIEAFLCHASAKRRVRVGLCDHVIANRYLLFGLFGVFEMLSCIVDVLSTSEAESAIVVTGFAIALGLFEILGIAILILAFFPPTSYQHWLESSTGAESMKG